MAYQRALWKSGLTYQQTCRTCNTTVTYMDNILDFRPWFPDGFVYCPTCKNPLRHHERYAINSIPAPTVDLTKTSVDVASGTASNFCTSCGAQFEENGYFCGKCGTPRRKI